MGQVLIRNLSLLFLLMVLGFLLPRLIPGSPLSFSGEEINVLNLRLPEDTFNRFKDYYVPEKPIIYQLLLYFQHLFRGDWGYSFHFGLPVKGIILSRVNLTLFLSITSIFLATSTALPLGAFMAISRNSAWHSFMLMSLVAVQSVPVFLLAILFQMFFAYQLGWFPSFGAYPPGMIPGDPEFVYSLARHSILPLLVLTLSGIPPVAILTRNVVQKVKGEFFVEQAYYFGIRSRIIRIYYILLNSMPEILGRLNIVFLYAVAGALFVEIIFSYPGMGALMKVAVESRDYPLIQGIFLVISLYSITVNLVFEIIFTKINPKLALK